MHALLTDDHALADVLDANHFFLPEHQRGKPREFEKINLATSAQAPSCRRFGSMHVIEQTFIHGYVKSVVRSSNIAASMQTLGFDVSNVALELAEFVGTGKKAGGSACVGVSSSNGLRAFAMRFSSLQRRLNIFG
ncbi:MAG: hypothetical protein H7Z77_01355 [Chitinophagaceae bacterium]|nr:hypothetical protein [Polaromonas sp.]